MTSAVVVGSGPNGLAAALTLAASGVQVTVVERADTLGGGVRSSELTLPGLVHDECSGLHPLAVDSAFTRRFDLAGAGLEWAWARHEYAHPFADGRGGAVVRSVGATAAALGEPGWSRVFGPPARDFDRISTEFLRPALHVPRHLLPLARFGVRSALPATVLARLLGSEEARALFLGVAAHAFRPLDAPMSAAVGMVLGTAAHRYGWPAAVGGSVAIRDAIVQRCEEHRVRFETGRTVTSLHELGTPDVVMLDTAPGQAARIVGDALPRRVRRAYTRFRHGPAAFKVDFAVEGGVPWRHEDSRTAGTVHVAGPVAETVAAERALAAGRMPERPFVLVGQQFLADPSRSHGDVHPVYAYAHVPRGYAADATEAIVARLEEFAPGFRDRIRATAVRSNTDLARHNPNYVGGDIATGANDPLQLLFRPRVSAHPYDTGVPGVYLCSAASPPGAGAHGMCGYRAAQRALDRLSGA